MNITVKPELGKLIENEVKSGRSPDSDNFLSKAVYHYVIARDLGEDYNREEMEEKIARGIVELERGEGIDGDEFFDQLRLHGEDFKRRGAGLPGRRVGSRADLS